MGLIIGAAAGGVVVIAIVIFACYKYRTKRNSMIKIEESNNQINDEAS